MNSCEITALVTAAANVISRGLSPEEISMLAAVFTQLGDTLATKAAFCALCEGSQKQNI